MSYFWEETIKFFVEFGEDLKYWLIDSAGWAWIFIILFATFIIPVCYKVQKAIYEQDLQKRNKELKEQKSR